MKHYDHRLIEECLHLYRRGSKQRVIASRKHVSMRTLARWIAEYKDSTIAKR